MAHDFYAAADALSNQSGQMSVALVVLQQKLDDAQNTENGIETPIGRSSLRDLLDQEITATRAQLDVSAEDVTNVLGRMIALKDQAEALDLRLSAAWQDLPA